MPEKPLYDKAEELWQSLAAVKQMAEHGITPDPSKLNEILINNRPTLNEKEWVKADDLYSRNA